MQAQSWNRLRYACLQYAKTPVNAPSRGAWRICNARLYHVDGRNRLSNFWTPTGGSIPPTGEDDIATSFLMRAGFLRQAHSGVFHLLPLGLRVQDKVERLIDKHMQSIGASKVSLSSLTTEDLWRESGRYSANSELLRVKDRRESGFLLSPTHEEEITALVRDAVVSYKDLPVRLYQITRKYRDERRPRQGLLRAKEFLMKDLYTFDYSPEMALETYKDVRAAYSALFDELKIPYLVADADSGAMGGNLSHEYHFVSPKGEDNVWSCTSCSYVANEELAEKGSRDTPPSPPEITMWEGISTDRETKVQVFVPKVDDTLINKTINLHAIKSAYPDLDTGVEASSLPDLLQKTTHTVRIYDHRALYRAPAPHHTVATTVNITKHPDSLKALDLTSLQPGDPCPRCEEGTLTVQRAIEIGHTFHLGTRYSEPLNAQITLPTNKKAPVQMGCHGIGVSRIIGAVAGLLADKQGLNWPRAIAPFEVVICPVHGLEEGSVEMVFDHLKDASVDMVIDDRPNKGMGWLLRDAELIGYPVVLVVGKAWKEERSVEVQCRRLGVREKVELGELRGVVMGLLEKL